jgi:hypothetical protein
MKMCDNNHFVLTFLEAQLASKAARDLKNGKGVKEEGEDDDVMMIDDADTDRDRASLFDLYTKETQLVPGGTTSTAQAEDIAGDEGDGGISMVIDREKKTKKKKLASSSSSASGSGSTLAKVDGSVRKKKRKN